MVTSDYKNCIDCGESFKKSPADATVRCPDCRRARRYGYDTSAKQRRSCVVCNGTQVITEQRADGSMHSAPCWKCG